MNNDNPIYNIIERYLVFEKDDPLILILFFSIKWTISGKYAFLKQVLENPFINQSSINFHKVFSKLQRMHFAIHRFIWIWRFKRAKIYNTEDLFMTTIREGQKGTITILENNTKYIFLIRELLNSIQTNLSNCSHFFPDVKPCKNPYTNLPIKKSNLYNIYFKIRDSAYKMPQLFENFFQESFDLQRFSRKNSFLINEQYLEQYSKTNINIHNIRECIDEMFSIYKLELKIHKDFPKYRLIEIMLPYIDLYNKSQYYMNTNKSERAYRLLYHKLHKFIEYNPIFGRKKINIINKYDSSINKFITEKIINYNDSHPVFEEPNKIPFMTNHMEFIMNIRAVGYQQSNIRIPVFIQNDSEEEDEEEDEEDEDEDEDEAEFLFDNEIPTRETNTPILYDSSSDDSDESE